MDYLKCITTDRLLLRDFVVDDWPAALVYQQDPRYLRLYLWMDRTETAARDFVRMFIDQQTELPRRKFQLAITLPYGGPMIGNGGIRRKPENDWEAELGYELVPDYWGRGYATEAARAIVSVGCRELGLHRISSWCIAENMASARVLEIVGLKL